MTRSIAIFMYEGGQSLDISGPMEVFALANLQQSEDAPGSELLYRLNFIAKQPGPITMSSGLQIHAALGFTDTVDGFDTLLVSGGMGDSTQRIRNDVESMNWLREMLLKVRRIGSICTGALVLAELGVLDGRRATTHWLELNELQQSYPETEVVPDAIYVRDGTVWTSAGITAGMDLALAMVAEDHGMSLALKVAKRMVMVTKRSGGQAQFSQVPEAHNGPDAFTDLKAWVQAHLSLPLDVPQIAAHVGMSERHFRRRFQDVFGMTPQKYLESIRIDTAKHLLENTRQDLKAIAIACGFSSEESMRRVFVRHLGVRPLEYRVQFGSLV